MVAILPFGAESKQQLFAPERLTPRVFRENFRSSHAALAIAHQDIWRVCKANPVLENVLRNRLTLVAGTWCDHRKVSQLPRATSIGFHARQPSHTSPRTASR